MRLMFVRTCAEPLLRRLSIALVLIAALPSCGGNSTSSSTSSSGLDFASITVQPTSPSMSVGSQLQFSALGTPASGGTVSVTSEVTWTSSSPGVATINSTGLATSLAAGKSQITASLGSIVGSSTLGVTGGSANLQEITITPADSEITASATVQLEALGTYSDGAGNITSSVTWTSTAPSVAAVSQRGAVTVGTVTGSTVITATLGTVSGSTTVTVVQ